MRVVREKERESVVAPAPCIDRFIVLAVYGT